MDRRPVRIGSLFRFDPSRELGCNQEPDITILLMKTSISRRAAITKVAGTAAIAAAASSLHSRLSAAEEKSAAGLKGRVNHSVCKWCYSKINLEDLCVAGKEMGLQSIELLRPKDFPILKKHGLTCAMVSSPDIDGKGLGGITRAFNRVEHHDKLVE